MKTLLRLFAFFLPWPLRRVYLNRAFGYQIHRTAKMGLAWVFPRRLVMEAGSRIDHFNVAIHLDDIILHANATIGRGNWITGMSAEAPSLHFTHQPHRQARLTLHEGASITKNHHIDCTNSITIGRFATVAGYQSQFLTHSINLKENRQHSQPIVIGAYTFVGTNVVVLGGSILPDYCVLGAKSLLNKPLDATWKLYAGVPAKMVGEIDREYQYFSRTDAFVY